MPKRMEEKELNHILELTVSMREAVEKIESLFNTGDFQNALALSSGLKDAAAATARAYDEERYEIFTGSQAVRVCDNIDNSVNRFAEAIRLSDLDKADVVLQCELRPLVYELGEDIYYFNCVYPDEFKMEKYYQERFSRHFDYVHHLNTGNFKYRVTIIVTAYNKLEYTKECIEQLFKYTDFNTCGAELVTIDNGSSDGTGEFFESLPHRKKIRFRTNIIGPMNGPYLCATEGQYTLYLPNDILVTRHWLENLLRCADENPNAALVTPTTNCISNFQAIPVSYHTTEEMQRFAEGYNESNPLKWEERARIIPVVWFCRSKWLRELRLSDRLFYFGEFTDDDFSLRARRAGLTMLLDKGTFVHHYGSVTMGDARKYHSLEISRNLFIKKHHIDPWSAGICYNPAILDALSYKKKGSVDVLGIDAVSGDGPLEIKNRLRAHGASEIRIYNVTCQKEFEADLSSPSVSDHFACYEDERELLPAWKQTEFDYIYMPRDLNQYRDPLGMLDAVLDRLKVNGQFSFALENMSSARNLYASLRLDTQARLQQAGMLRWISLEAVLEHLKKRGIKVEVLKVKVEKNLQQVAFLKNIYQMDDAAFDKSIVSVSYWVFTVIKQADYRGECI